MAQLKMPQRPAMLDAAKADAIIGDEDPATSVAVAHTAAWVPMGVGDETFTDAGVARLYETVRISGADTIAYVWSRSSEFTLLGALWRVYLLHEWYHRDPFLVAECYAEGSRASIIQGPEASVELRPLSLIMEEVDSLLRDDLTDDDLEYVLGKASCAMRVLTAGEAGAPRIEDPADPLTHRVTTRHSALPVIADELDIAACETAISILDWPHVRCVVADLGVPWTTLWKARTGVTRHAH